MQEEVYFNKKDDRDPKETSINLFYFRGRATLIEKWICWDKSTWTSLTGGFEPKVLCSLIAQEKHYHSLNFSLGWPEVLFSLARGSVDIWVGLQTEVDTQPGWLALLFGTRKSARVSGKILRKCSRPEVFEIRGKLMPLLSSCLKVMKQTLPRSNRKLRSKNKKVRMVC